jgi:hypothetical protein
MRIHLENPLYLYPYLCVVFASAVVSVVLDGVEVEVHDGGAADAEDDADDDDDHDAGVDAVVARSVLVAVFHSMACASGDASDGSPGHPSDAVDRTRWPDLGIWNRCSEAWTWKIHVS